MEKSISFHFSWQIFPSVFIFNIEIQLDNDNVYIDEKPWKRNVEWCWHEKSWEKHGMGNLMRYYSLNAGSLGHQILTLSWGWWKAGDALVISPQKVAGASFVSFFRLEFLFTWKVEGTFWWNCFSCLTSLTLNCLSMFCAAPCSIFCWSMTFRFPS